MYDFLVILLISIIEFSGINEIIHIHASILILNMKKLVKNNGGKSSFFVTSFLLPISLIFR